VVRIATTRISSVHSACDPDTAILQAEGGQSCSGKIPGQDRQSHSAPDESAVSSWPWKLPAMRVSAWRNSSDLGPWIELHSYEYAVNQTVASIERMPIRRHIRNDLIRVIEGSV
jgi:hypothetical protein